MTTFKCKSCGVDNEVYVAPTATVKEIPGWREAVGPELAEMLQKKFNATSGLIEETKGGGAWIGTGAQYMTLYLSKLSRQPIIPLEDRKESDVFAEFIVPALKKVVDAGFIVIGSAAPPSSVPLAVVNLTAPKAVFTYVTVVKPEQWDAKQKLKEIGLPYVLMEGMVDTLEGRERSL